MRVSLSLAASLIVCTIVMPLRGQQAPAAGAGQPAAPRPAPLRSSEIQPDRTVTFRLLAPKAPAQNYLALDTSECDLTLV